MFKVEDAQENNTIASPFYPLTSVNNQYWRCNYTIQVDDGYSVVLKITDLDLERNVGFLKVIINEIETSEFILKDLHIAFYTFMCGNFAR